MQDDPYVLRERDREELVRLEGQHKIWHNETRQVVERAGFRSGDRLVDIGCGPGFLTLELAAVVGPEGFVLGVDTSDLFVQHLRREAASQGLDQERAQDPKAFVTAPPVLASIGRKR